VQHDATDGPEDGLAGTRTVAEPHSLLDESVDVATEPEAGWTLPVSLGALAAAVTGLAELGTYVFLGSLAGIIIVRRGERLGHFAQAALAMGEELEDEWIQGRALHALAFPVLWSEWNGDEGSLIDLPPPPPVKPSNRFATSTIEIASPKVASAR